MEKSAIRISLSSRFGTERNGMVMEARATLVQKVGSLGARCDIVTTKTTLQTLNLRLGMNLIKANFSDQTIRVYQAFGPEIAIPALQSGRFVPPFSMRRMTWIKPSFNWMMYRSGYATKPGQEFILGIDITRDGFEWALKNSVLSSFNPTAHRSLEGWRMLLATKPVRIQWDPERDWQLNSIAGVRTIQIGLSGEATERYVNHWIVRIEDLTPIAKIVRGATNIEQISAVLPSVTERPYPFDFTTATAIFPQ